MNNTADGAVDTAEAPVVNVEELDSLGRAVVADMRAIREQLAARNTALEECYTSLLEFHGELVGQHETLEQREKELCAHYEQRQADIAAREQRCTQQEEHLRAESARVVCAQGELERLRAELAPRCQAAEALEAKLKSHSATLSAREQELAASAREIDARSRATEEGLARVQAAEAELNARSAQLAARSQELDAQRSALTAKEDELRKESEGTVRREAAVQAQQAELERMMAEAERQRAVFDEEEAALHHAQAEAAAMISEVETARGNLAKLQKQLQEELNALAEQKGELLMRYGLAQGGDGTPQSAGPLPKLPDGKNRASADRFQKLCRDAKRKAIGAQ